MRAEKCAQHHQGSNQHNPDHGNPDIQDKQPVSSIKKKSFEEKQKDGGGILGWTFEKYHNKQLSKTIKHIWWGGENIWIQKEMWSTNWLGIKVGSEESCCLRLGQTLGESLLDGHMTWKDEGIVKQDFLSLLNHWLTASFPRVLKRNEMGLLLAVQKRVISELGKMAEN